VVFVYQFGVPFALSLSKGEREGTFGVRVKTIWSSAGPIHIWGQSKNYLVFRWPQTPFEFLL
jgi:hypothetical protein